MVKPAPEVVKLLQPEQKVSNPDFSLEGLSLDAYPNPTVGMLNVRFEAEAVPTTVRITDAAGRTVYEKVLNQFPGYFDEQVNLDGQAPGIFTLTVQQGKKMISKNSVLMART